MTAEASVNLPILGTLIDQKLREFHYRTPIRLGNGGPGQRRPIVGLIPAHQHMWDCFTL